MTTTMQLARILVALVSALFAQRVVGFVPSTLFHRQAFATHSLSASAGQADVDKRTDQLIAKAKEFITTASGFYSAGDDSFYSDDFVFRGPFVGPLNKNDYLATLKAFSPKESFPDLNPNPWGFSIDPINPDRVWFMVRMTGTFQKELELVPGIFKVPANGAKVQGAPETYSILFDKDNKVKCLTVGYIADRFEGNTGGLGALFGILHAVGISLPKPPNPLFRILNLIPLPGAPKAVSDENDIPAWWTSKARLDDGI